MRLLHPNQIVDVVERYWRGFRFCFNRTGYWGDGQHPDLDLGSSWAQSSPIFRNIKDDYGYEFHVSYHNRLKFFQNQIMYFAERRESPIGHWYNGGVIHLEQQFAYDNEILQIGYQ